MTIRTILGALLIGNALALAMPTATEAQRSRAQFEAAIDAVIAELPPQAGAVTERIVTYFRHSRGSDEGRLRRVVAWLRVEGCEEGYVNITLSPRARVVDVYTRGGCVLPGL